MMPTVSSSGLHPDFTQWKVGVIQHHHHPFRGDSVKVGRGSYSLPTQIHEGLRFAQQYLGPTDPYLGDF